jgi:hypothetical protein
MGDGSWTVYIGAIYEKSSDGRYVKYYSAFGRRIAMRDNADVVHYVLADHLGSSTVVTDSGGGEVGTMKYYPYCAERTTTGEMITDKLFIGQQRIAFLEPRDIIGAYNWWKYLSWRAIGSLIREGKYIKQHEEILWDVTLSTARGIEMLAAYNHECVSLDSYPWLAFQRNHLARFGLVLNYGGQYAPDY